MSDTPNQAPPLPLAGIRVVEFTHMVMGPSCGMILGDLGAEVIKVEPLAGDSTRRLLGSGAGFFAMFNRNKQSLAVDVNDARGREVVLRLVAGADVFSENFKTGTMDRLGFGAEALARLNPRLIHVSHKGFLPGPYDQRTALDEVVQMMGGLAYMTGPEGRPLRAGSSVNDIMGAKRCSSATTCATAPARARPCRARCSRTTCCWWPSTWCSSPSPASRPRPCPAASAPGRCTTCSPAAMASRSFWPLSATRSGR